MSNDNNISQHSNHDDEIFINYLKIKRKLYVPPINIFYIY